MLISHAAAHPPPLSLLPPKLHRCNFIPAPRLLTCGIRRPVLPMRCDAPRGNVADGLRAALPLAAFGPVLFHGGGAGHAAPQPHDCRLTPLAHRPGQQTRDAELAFLCPTHCLRQPAWILQRHDTVFEGAKVAAGLRNSSLALRLPLCLIQPGSWRQRGSVRLLRRETGRWRGERDAASYLHRLSLR